MDPRGMDPERRNHSIHNPGTLVALRAFPRTVYGCVVRQRDVLVAVMMEADGRTKFAGVYLTQEQAEGLVAEIQAALEANKQEAP